MATPVLSAAPRINITHILGDGRPLVLTVYNPTGDLYNSTAVYYTGNIIHDSSGDIWAALQDAFSGQSPAENSYWTAVDPYWNLTGMTIEGDIRDGIGGTVEASFTVTLSNPTNGEFTAIPVEASLGSLTAGTKAADFFYTDTGGTRAPLCRITLTVLEPATAA